MPVLFTYYFCFSPVCWVRFILFINKMVRRIRVREWGGEIRQQGSRWRGVRGHGRRERRWGRDICKSVFNFYILNIFIIQAKFFITAFKKYFIFFILRSFLVKQLKYRVQWKPSHIYFVLFVFYKNYIYIILFCLYFVKIIVKFIECKLLKKYATVPFLYNYFLCCLETPILQQAVLLCLASVWVLTRCYRGWCNRYFAASLFTHLSAYGKVNAFNLLRVNALMIIKELNITWFKLKNITTQCNNSIFVSAFVIDNYLSIYI